MTRKEIESKWMRNSEGFPAGLSPYVAIKGTPLYEAWDKIVLEGSLLSWVQFLGEFDEDHKKDLVYLCRALSLNMLLDDNGVL